MFAHVKRISSTYIQILTLALAIIILQSVAQQFLCSSSSSNIFSQILLESSITLALNAVRCIKLEQKTEEPGILEDMHVLMYFLQLSAVLFSISVLSSTLRSYYSRVLITSLKTFEIPFLDLKSIIKKGTDGLELEFSSSHMLSTIIQCVFVFVLTISSINHCSPVGILIFVLFIVVLTVKQRYKARVNSISYVRAKIIAKSSEIIITFPFFLLFGSVNDIKSYKNIAKALFNIISSMCSNHLLSIIRQKYNNIYIHTCIMAKAFKILKVCIKSNGVSILQLSALLPLFISFYIRNTRLYDMSKVNAFKQ
ncbi:uncharacterized protein VICG_00547 [Vittaforma corneae ATCC 50505]|uniref:Uncharacterized protein n=1 Tax=Vittaforma corneae (strain ATCC 50505) TaxID=993615 RepID=L2GNH7_VITCO|nr:uncharacterized protein VICG_00547 [Vittaforma corneae ATCC 50505]ELA42448.1 hypothetical protein VICG_00547 [Vittaforma corneae ATCC 50505]